MNDSPKPGLLRVVGPWIGAAVVVGTVIGGGVFMKPRMIAQNVPDFLNVALVWTVGGAFTLLGSLALAEIAVLFPVAGGNYIFLREGLGRLPAFLWGWVDFWMIKGGSIAALATAFVDGLHGVLQLAAGHDQPWLSPTMHIAITVGVIALLAAVNIRGVMWGGGLQFGITLVKMVSLLAILVLPFALIGFRDPEGIRASLFNQPESTAFHWSGIGAAMLGVLWAYHGWMNIAPLAGEIANPQRNIPLALIGGMGAVIFLYLGANLAYCLVLPMTEMAALPPGSIVSAVFAGRLLGATGTLLALAAVMISVFGALNGNLLVGPRLLYAMGKDGLAPHALGRVHARFHTPAIATMTLAAWSMILIVAGSWAQDQFQLSASLFDLMTDFAMFGAIIFETLAVSTIFIFRRRMPDAPRLYRCPGYPWVPLIYLCLPAYVLVCEFTSNPAKSQFAAGFIALGAVVYWLWEKNNPTPANSAPSNVE